MIIYKLPVKPEDYPKFKKEFWQWFDFKLHPLQKKNLQQQPVDVAEEIYYELYWKDKYEEIKLTK
jgi:hypothetical protein